MGSSNGSEDENAFDYSALLTSAFSPVYPKLRTVTIRPVGPLRAIKAGCCRLPGAQSTASKGSAHPPSHLPRQPNPQSGARGTLRAPSPAGSFLGGFRTPATGVCRTALAGRHPKPCTKAHSCSAASGVSFDDLVGASEKQLRDGNAERLCGLHVD